MYMFYMDAELHVSCCTLSDCMIPCDFVLLSVLLDSKL